MSKSTWECHRSWLIAFCRQCHSGLILAVAITIFFGSIATGYAKSPNFVIFYLDDMGWGQPSCYGGKLAPTPNMDAIAAQGVRFTNGYSSGCICTPGRVGLVTGRYQSRTGQDANATGPGKELLLSEITMGQHLKKAGYATGIIGKWHLGVTSPEYLPTARGFDVAMGTVGNLGEGKGPAFYRDDKLLSELEGEPITSPIYSREACQFLNDHQAQPFLLYLSFNAVHSPIVASKPWLEKFKHLDARERAYAALISEADEAIGNVMEKLRELRLEEDTLVFCISDNGGANEIAEQLGCRGRKWTVWEGGVRVTWMMQWKGRIEGGRVVDTPVIQLDVLPTMLAACQSSPISDAPLDGVNLLPLLENGDSSLDDRALYFRFGVQHAVRQGDWKLVKASLDMEPMLVNLRDDPGEQTDLTSRYPEKKAELTAAFDAWNATMVPPRWEDKRWNYGNDKSKESKSKGKGKKKK